MGFEGKPGKMKVLLQSSERRAWIASFDAFLFGAEGVRSIKGGVVKTS